MTENEIFEFFELGGSPRQLEQAVREGQASVKRLAETLEMSVRSLKSLASRWGILRDADLGE